MLVILTTINILIPKRFIINKIGINEIKMDWDVKKCNLLEKRGKKGKIYVLKM